MSSIASSAQYYTLTIEEARELFKLALQAKACDSLVAFQEKEIQASLKVIQAADSLVNLYRQDLHLVGLEKTTLKEQVKVQEKMVQAERRKKRDWKGASVGLLVLTILLAGR